MQTTRPLLALVVAFAGCHDFNKIKKGFDGSPPAAAPPDAGDEVGPTADAGADQVVADASPDLGPPEQLPPSCAPRRPTCGPKGESCCASAMVPGDSQFARGHDRGPAVQDGKGVTGWQQANTYLTHVSPFSLDKFEVTIGRFREFRRNYASVLNTAPMQGNGRHPMNPSSGWNQAQWNSQKKYAANKDELDQLIGACNSDRPTKDILKWLDDPMGANDRLPMSCVSWYEAYLFCIWDGGRLPTETEWGFAAVGGQKYRPYPWDDAATLLMPENHANIRVGSFSSFNPKEVGSLPGAGLWDHHDLAGNVYEWVRDFFAVTPTEPFPRTYVAGASDPIKLETEYPPGTDLQHIVRGGSFLFERINARSTYRFMFSDLGRAQDIGWRCARNPTRP